MSTDPKKPNHFYHDGAGDPATCTEDHNHPEPESDEGPVVEATVEAIPAKRTARYEVPLDGMAHLSRHKLTASVNVKSITFGSSSDIPKTIEAADAIIALAQAVRAELVEQGAKK